MLRVEERHRHRYEVNPDIVPELEVGGLGGWVGEWVVHSFTYASIHVSRWVGGWVIQSFIRPSIHLFIHSFIHSFIHPLQAAGLRFVGRDETGRRMEVLELGGGKHPFFVAAQFHPEFKSRPTQPSPLFLGLLRAAALERARRGEECGVEG